MADAKQPPSSSNAADKAAAAAAAGVGIGMDRLVRAMRVVLAVSLVCATVVQSRSILARAYSIRLHAIETYGYGELLTIYIWADVSRFVSFSHNGYIYFRGIPPPRPSNHVPSRSVIHEFDPYFNFRAAQYLYDNGWERFAKWFDYKVWYPLGRPVGTTIYPGMQVKYPPRVVECRPRAFAVAEIYHIPPHLAQCVTPPFFFGSTENAGHRRLAHQVVAARVVRRGGAVVRDEVAPERCRQIRE